MAVVECKAFAVVDSGSVVELAQVLRGLCSRYVSARCASVLLGMHKDLAQHSIHSRDAC
jgi:hypothetical protein